MQRVTGNAVTGTRISGRKNDRRIPVPRIVRDAAYATWIEWRQGMRDGSLVWDSTEGYVHNPVGRP